MTLTHVCQVCGGPAPYFTDTYDPEKRAAVCIYLCREHQQKLHDRIREDLEELGKIDELLKAAKEGPLFEETALQPCVIPQTQTLTIQGPPELMATVKSVTIEFKEEADE